MVFAESPHVRLRCLARVGLFSGTGLLCPKAYVGLHLASS
ncbi:hypothetical protein COLSTE_01426 [Collinsella stercoris DSM 13279]|uniref:Uncharacterized protein n=1 Tax=Collinsella stercoris DSM 13279 TaxID=445975 RepID=B6GBG7_9ACTN|nr:hypothetical protein COLSTE_01426 [Collinsella stercoris DSM 13279]